MVAPWQNTLDKSRSFGGPWGPYTTIVYLFYQFTSHWSTAFQQFSYLELTNVLIPRVFTKTKRERERVSGVRREVDESCALLGYYAASGFSLLPTSRNNLSVLSSGVKALDPWRWDRYVVPKPPLEIITTRCLITQKSAVFRRVRSRYWIGENDYKGEGEKIRIALWEKKILLRQEHAAVF